MLNLAFPPSGGAPSWHSVTRVFVSEQLFGVIDDHIIILPEAHAVQLQNLSICNSTNHQRHPDPVQHLSCQIQPQLQTVLWGKRWRS